MRKDLATAVSLLTGVAAIAVIFSFVVVVFAAMPDAFPGNETAPGQIKEQLDEIGEQVSLIVEKFKLIPKIYELSPLYGPVGTAVTVSGSGFALDNSIFVHGRTVLSGVESIGGTLFTFVLSESFTCSVGSACPIKVVNENGISNARVFYLIEPPLVLPFPLPPPVEPTSSPIEPPPSPRQRRPF